MKIRGFLQPGNSLTQLGSLCSWLCTVHPITIDNKIKSRLWTTTALDLRHLPRNEGFIMVSPPSPS